MEKRCLVMIILLVAAPSLCTRGKGWNIQDIFGSTTRSKKPETSGTSTRTTPNDIEKVYRAALENFKNDEKKEKFDQCFAGLCHDQLRILFGRVYFDANQVVVSVDETKVEAKSDYILAPIEFKFPPGFTAELKFTYKGSFAKFIGQKKHGQAVATVGPASIIVKAKFPAAQEDFQKGANAGVGKCKERIPSNAFSEVTFYEKFQVDENNINYKPNMKGGSRPKIKAILDFKRPDILKNIGDYVLAYVAELVSRVPFTCMDDEALRTIPHSVHLKDDCPKSRCNSFSNDD